MSDAEKIAVAFIKDILAEYWPDCCGIDGETIQSIGEKTGVMVRVKYDPGIHGESEYDCEPGDDWFVLNPILGAIK